MRCCRSIVLALNFVVSLCAVALIWAGAVRTYNLSLDNTTNDGMLPLLANFTRCSDLKDMAQAGTGNDDYAKVVLGECIGRQAPYLGLYCIGGVFALFASIAGLIAGCKESKISSYSFSIFSAASFAIIVAGIFVMAQTTAPATSKLIPCRDFDQDTISLLTSSGFVCINGLGDGDNSTAVYWLVSVGLYYGGAITAIVSLLIHLMSNCCCTRRDEKEGADESRVPLQPQPYGSYGSTPYQSGQYA